MDEGVDPTEVIYTEPFLDDLAQIEQDSKIEEIFTATDLLSTVPEIGSKKVPQAVKDRFGNAVYRIVVSPFLVLYEYEKEQNKVILLGIMHSRQAY